MVGTVVSESNDGKENDGIIECYHFPDVVLFIDYEARGSFYWKIGSSIVEIMCYQLYWCGIDGRAFG